ncbi:hypothetical protein ACWGQ2_11620 [Arthrobacter sp. NPDC055585]
MLDKELRQKLQPLRDDLARVTDPEYDLKTPVYRLAKELNRSIQWVIRKTGGDFRDMDESSRLTSAQESSVRTAHQREEAPRPKRREPAPVTIKALALELGVPRHDVAEEVIRRGVARKHAKSSLPLTSEEVEILTSFFAERTKSRQRIPVVYRPSPDGKISFETYQRIPVRIREGLVKAGFLPSLSEMVRYPDREWGQIIKHFRQVRDQQQVARDTVSGRTPPIHLKTHSRSTQSKAQSSVVSASGSSTSAPSREPSALGRPRITTATATALIPPKPASVLRLQNQGVTGLIRKEIEGGLHTGSAPESAFQSFKTSIGTNSTAVVGLQQTLREFHPSMYSKFFDQFREALELDRRIAQTMGRRKNYGTTNPEHARIINEVCEYKYGIFAYADIGAKLGRIARLAPSPSARNIKNGLVKLRPMYMGVLTDMSHHRFVLWRVGKTWDLLEVRFEDTLDWVEGLKAGEYVPLTTHHIPLGTYKNPVSSDLSRRDQDIVKFMVEVAGNLRQGVRGVRGKKATSGLPAMDTTRGTQSPLSPPRQLGYRPESTWLVPITITDGQVNTTLDEDFFSSPDDKKPSEVRPFYRRPKGSAPNAPRTEFVSGHIRGGRGAFADMKLLPVVTIRR